MEAFPRSIEPGSLVGRLKRSGAEKRLRLNLKTSVERCKPFDTPAARATQGERSLTKLVITPFVLSSAVSCAYRSMSGVQLSFLGLWWLTGRNSPLMREIHMRQEGRLAISG